MSNIAKEKLMESINDLIWNEEDVVVTHGIGGEMLIFCQINEACPGEPGPGGGNGPYPPGLSPARNVCK